MRGRSSRFSESRRRGPQARGSRVDRLGWAGAAKVTLFRRAHTVAPYRRGRNARRPRADVLNVLQMQSHCEDYSVLSEQKRLVAGEAPARMGCVHGAKRLAQAFESETATFIGKSVVDVGLPQRFDQRGQAVIVGAASCFRLDEGFDVRMAGLFRLVQQEFDDIEFEGCPLQHEAASEAAGATLPRRQMLAGDPAPDVADFLRLPASVVRIRRRHFKDLQHSRAQAAEDSMRRRRSLVAAASTAPPAITTP